MKTIKQQYQKSTEPRTIYRLEHPESGKGPYTHTSRAGFASDAMRYITEPIEMGYRGMMGHHFAFDSVASLWSAIDRLVLLSEFGFHIQTYEVTECLVFEDGQVAFSKDKSTLISSVRVREFPFRDHA